MADTIYEYRTPAEFPDRIQLGDNAAGNFSDQEYDSDLQRHELQLFANGAILGTYTFGADGFIRFNGDSVSGGDFGNLDETQLADIAIVSANIVSLQSIATSVDNINDVALALTDGAFDNLEETVLAKDQAQAAAAAAQVAEDGAETAATAAANNAATALAAATSADNDAAAAGAASTLAEQWATAPSDSEVAPGLKSSRAYALDAQAFARAIAGIPYREVTGAAATLTKTTLSAAGDEFSAILCTGATNKTITLPPDFNIIPALDGRPAFVPVRIMRTGAGTVTIAGAGGTSATPPSVIGEWQAPWRTPIDPPPSSTTAIVRSITVPAGLNRKLFVVCGEVNTEVASRVITLASSPGTVTVQTSDTAPTGRYNVAPEVNSKSWTVALADSPSSGTNVDLTFTVPGDSASFTYKVWAAKDVAAISGVVGSSISTGSKNHSLSITSPADGLVMAGFVHKGSVLPVTLTGGTPSTAINTGISGVTDHMMVTGHLANAPAGANAFATTWVEIKQGAVLGCCFEAAIGGGSSVTIVGTPLTIGTDGSVDILAASDGRTYYLRHGA